MLIWHVNDYVIIVSGTIFTVNAFPTYTSCWCQEIQHKCETGGKVSKLKICVSLYITLLLCHNTHHMAPLYNTEYVRDHCCSESCATIPTPSQNIKVLHQVPVCFYWEVHPLMYVKQSDFFLPYLTGRIQIKPFWTITAD